MRYKELSEEEVINCAVTGFSNGSIDDLIEEWKK